MLTGRLFLSDFAPRFLSPLCSSSLRFTSVVIPVYKVLSLHFAIYTYHIMAFTLKILLFCQKNSFAVCKIFRAPPRGIEPLSPVPKTGTLSVKLRRQHPKLYQIYA